MRLNRYLASAGLGSRRGVEQIILEGRVRINGQVVTDLSTQVGPNDAVKVGNRLLRLERPLYAILHKPKGSVCTADDERDRTTIFEFLPRDWPRVHYVGRLDMDSEGILLITNDGDLTNHLTHPSHEVEKEYEVLLDRPFNTALHREKMLRGFRIQSGYAKCERLEVLHPNHLRIVLKQGLNRQIRLMLYDVGEYEVERLMRIRMGSIELADLPAKQWRFLSQKEVDSLRANATPAPASAPRATRAPHPRQGAKPPEPGPSQPGGPGPRAPKAPASRKAAPRARNDEF